MRHGDKVRCTGDGIDKRGGKGSVGVVAGFGQFSQSHPPEVWVDFEENPSQSGWFWKADVEPLETAVAA